MTSPAIAPPPPGTVFTKDPVAIVTAIFTFLLGVTSVLLITGVFSDVAGGIIAGVLTAAWAAVQLMFVKPATVPRQPLAELAYAESTEHTVQHTTGSTATTYTNGVTPPP